MRIKKIFELKEDGSRLVDVKATGGINQDPVETLGKQGAIHMREEQPLVRVKEVTGLADKDMIDQIILIVQQIREKDVGIYHKLFSVEEELKIHPVRKLIDNERLLQKNLVTVEKKELKLGQEDLKMYEEKGQDSAKSANNLKKNESAAVVAEDDVERDKKKVVGGGFHGGKRVNSGKKGKSNPFTDWKMYRSIGKKECSRLAKTNKSIKQFFGVSNKVNAGSEINAGVEDDDSCDEEKLIEKDSDHSKSKSPELQEANESEKGVNVDDEEDLRGTIEKTKSNFAGKDLEQAGAELCQAQVKLS
jgi:hypothetical protein